MSPARVVCRHAPRRSFWAAADTISIDMSCGWFSISKAFATQDPVAQMALPSHADRLGDEIILSSAPTNACSHARKLAIFFSSLRYLELVM